MFQRDYILRLIELFAKIVARVLQLKENKEYDQALQEIGEAYRSLLGIPAHLVHSMWDFELIDLLKSGEKCGIMAGLLKEEAEIYALQNKKSESVLIYFKALSLLLEAPEIQSEELDKILHSLENYETPARLKRKLISYHERSGNYSRAEDLLFELADAPDSSIREFGISFYSRLKEKSSEDLQKGNLSPEEIVEGLSAFERKLAHHDI